MTPPHDPAGAPRPRGLLGHLAGTLPRRRAEPRRGRGARDAGAVRPGAPAAGRTDPLWWDVLTGAADAADRPAVAEVPGQPAVPGVVVPGVRPAVVEPGVVGPGVVEPAPPPVAPPADVRPSVVRVSAVRPAPLRAPRAVRSSGDVVPAPARPGGTLGGSAVAARPAPPADRGPEPGAPPALLLTDGRRLPLTSTVLVGRNPTPRAGETVGALVAVDDPARSVSATHLLVGVDDAGVWLVDRRSTNGTLVTLPDGQGILCVPERPVRLVVGARVDFGDHGFTLAVPADRLPAG